MRCISVSQQLCSLWGWRRKRRCEDRLETNRAIVCHHVEAPPCPARAERRGSPLLSSLLPLHCVPSPGTVIKTTGGTRNTAWLLPACNRHHLVHRRGFFFFPSPPSSRQGLKLQRLGSLIGPQWAAEQKGKYPVSFESFCNTKREMGM